MKQMRIGLILAVMIVVIGAGSAMAGRKTMIDQTYEVKESIRIRTVSGNVTIQAWDKNEIHVLCEASVRPRDSFEPEVNDRGKSLRISEDFYGSSSGRVNWTISVPASSNIRYGTASGDFYAKGLSGDLRLETASGDIELENCTGEMDINTASGDINLDNVTGFMSVNAASGDIDGLNLSGALDFNVASGSIDLEKVTLTESGSFNTASGRVTVSMASTPEFDMVISSASGSAFLDLNGHEPKGTYEFWARYRNGRISSPIDFDEEEKVRRHGERYMRKMFVKGDETPLIIIKTASGRASLDL